MLRNNLPVVGVVPGMKIDIWSDIVCPFCYIGKRHLEQALADFEHRDEVEIVWHSFELDPSAPAVADKSLVEKIADKYGISVEESTRMQEQVAASAEAAGLTLAWSEARYGNTFDAHRLVHLAATKGLADAAHERLMRAYFTEGLAVGDHDTLVRLGAEIGLDEAEVRELLGGDGLAVEVRADQEQARAYGITGVPFFVLDGKYGVSGAQPVELFRQALAQAWAERSPLQMVAATGEKGDPTCGPDGCTV